MKLKYWPFVIIPEVAYQLGCFGLQRAQDPTERSLRNKEIVILFNKKTEDRMVARLRNSEA